MPDPAPDDPTPDTGGDPTPDTPPNDPPSPDKGDDAAKWKALARKHEAQAKANADAAKKLADLENAQKTETERLTERLTAAEQRAVDALRYEVALDKGLTRSQAKRLVGTTLEELQADADELLEDLGVRADGAPPRPPSGKPKERLRGGGDPEETPEETDPAKLAAAVPRAGGFI